MTDKSQTTLNASIRHIPLPDRMKSLPVSSRGFPVPWFVAWIDGVPDFRVIREDGIAIAHKRKKCWVCGGPIGRYLAMSLGPMCAINRTIQEPPSHRECAIYAATACPFLANPRMRRHEAGLPENIGMAGYGIKRNPGACAVWVTRSYRPFADGKGGMLFTFDDPEEVLWFAEGRKATRAEVEASIDSGFPLLEAAARQDTQPGAMKALMKMRAEAMQYLPAA